MRYLPSCGAIFTSTACVRSKSASASTSPNKRGRHCYPSCAWKQEKMSAAIPQPGGSGRILSCPTRTRNTRDGCCLRLAFAWDFPNAKRKQFPLLFFLVVFLQRSFVRSERIAVGLNALVRFVIFIRFRGLRMLNSRQHYAGAGSILFRHLQLHAVQGIDKTPNGGRHVAHDEGMDSLRFEA